MSTTISHWQKKNNSSTHTKKSSPQHKLTDSAGDRTGLQNKNFANLSFWAPIRIEPISIFHENSMENKAQWTTIPGTKIRHLFISSVFR